MSEQKKNRADLAEEYSALLFGTRRSIRYHLRRQRFLDGLHRCGALFTTVAGSATVVFLLAQYEPASIAAAALTAFFGAFEVVFAPARLARDHNGLAREFIALEKELIRAEGALDDGRLQELQVARLDIEAKEPPALRVLDAMCHDELARAMGLGDDERSNVTWLQRLFANFFDISEPRIRKRGELSPTRG